MLCWFDRLQSYTTFALCACQTRLETTDTRSLLITTTLTMSVRIWILFSTCPLARLLAYATHRSETSSPSPSYPPSSDMHLWRTHYESVLLAENIAFSSLAPSCWFDRLQFYQRYLHFIALQSLLLVLRSIDPVRDSGRWERQWGWGRWTSTHNNDKRNRTL